MDGHLQESHPPHPEVGGRNRRLLARKPFAAISRFAGGWRLFAVFPIAGPFPFILNLLKDGQRRQETQDGTEWRRPILQQVQDERVGRQVQDYPSTKFRRSG